MNAHLESIREWHTRADKARKDNPGELDGFDGADLDELTLNVGWLLGQLSDLRAQLEEMREVRDSYKTGAGVWMRAHTELGAQLEAEKALVVEKDRQCAGKDTLARELAAKLAEQDNEDAQVHKLLDWHGAPRDVDGCPMAIWARVSDLIASLKAQMAESEAEVVRREFVAYERTGPTGASEIVTVPYDGVSDVIAGERCAKDRAESALAEAREALSLLLADSRGYAIAQRRNETIAMTHAADVLARTDAPESEAKKAEAQPELPRVGEAQKPLFRYGNDIYRHTHECRDGGCIGCVDETCGTCKGAGAIVSLVGVFRKDAMTCPDCKGTGRAQESAPFVPTVPQISPEQMKQLGDEGLTLRREIERQAKEMAKPAPDLVTVSRERFEAMLAVTRCADGLTAVMAEFPNELQYWGEGIDALDGAVAGLARLEAAESEADNG